MTLLKVKSQNELLDSFQLLFLKKIDARLTVQERSTRDTADKVVMGCSTVGNLGAFFYLIGQLSVARGEKFNPIRDVRTTIASVTFLLAARTLGTLIMWNKIEPIYLRVLPKLNTE